MQQDTNGCGQCRNQGLGVRGRVAPRTPPPAAAGAPSKEGALGFVAEGLWGIMVCGTGKPVPYGTFPLNPRA